MKYHLTKFYLTLIFFSFALLLNAQTNEEKDFNCFSILIGSKATADGSVMFAHNEDDFGERVVNWYRVPDNHPGDDSDSIILKRKGKISQSGETLSYLWLEIPELEFSDSYFNEYGVIIASDACVSREDEPQLTDGGIGYWLRRAMAERARSAREAVKIGGKLVDEMGYASSGRTYCIADPNEAWMLSVVKGKHWIAERIPDNQIAIIPNYYTITTVDLSDTVNFLGSPDIVEYAVEKGWYNPETDGKFNFRKAYSDQGNLQSLGNKARHWITLNALSEKQYDIDDKFPFSFVPKNKVELQDIYQTLRNHYEGTELDITNGFTEGSPHHQKAMSVCSSTNQYGFVAQLRNWMPVEVGAVLWIAPRRPCTEPFVPVYSCLLSVPDNFAVTDYKSALTNHFNKIDDFEEYSKNQEYVLFGKKAAVIDENYGKLISPVKKSIEELEDELISNQAGFEKKMLKTYNRKPEQAKELLTEYSLKQILKARNIARKSVK